MRATVLTPLILLGWSLQAIGQSPARPSGEQPSLEAQSPVASENELKLVVALFRHGVRAPLKEIEASGKKPHAQDPWPTQSQWGVKHWGDLTTHGVSLVEALGRYYAQTYQPKFPTGFKSFLWADTAERTRATADALAVGLKAEVNCRQEDGPDPLFHPFEAHCGIPDPKRLLAISDRISASSQSWITSRFKKQFGELYSVLCPDPTKCDPLKSVNDNSANACDSPGTGCSGPIAWHGQFPYANTASETFLLEYANKMDVGWARVLEPPPDETRKLLSMMALHEFYFEQTQRDKYVSTIEASNLLREITRTLNVENVPCRRIPIGYQFGALVGHDTNIASVASLLCLNWNFTDAPVGTRGLSDNDPLPAGALLFELWSEANGPVVRIFYAAQGLREMRNFSGESCPAFRLPVQCNRYSVEANACTIPLKVFNQIVTDALGREFLSRCEGSDQVCGPSSGAAR
jgi:4-phytase / acid phosphatase